MTSKSNFIELLFAKRLGNMDEIHEASLGRVMQHASNAETNGFAILTSWRQSLSRKENLELFADLKGTLRGMGLGFNTLTGHWRECQDTTVPYEDCPEEELIDAVEPSVFVTGITMEEAQSIGNQYMQDAIVYAGPETDGNTVLAFRDGDQMSLGAFSPMSIGQAYSKLKSGRSFRFEYVEWPTQGHTEALMESSFRKSPLQFIAKL